MSALEGMRVLDLTQYEAGTSCTQWLGWLGADVVKVERPGRGEAGRTITPGPGDSGYFIYWNSNKRSVAIDLDHEAGRALLLELAPRYDVLAENYAPGVMEKLGLDYEAVKRVHPGIIYARIKGFGSDGPYASYKCYDMVAQAAGGIFSITGEAGGPPLRSGATLSDAGSGLQLALGITAAYVQKLRDGVGQLVEVSMQEATAYFVRTTLGTLSDYGRKPAPRTGNGYGPTTNLYPCAPGGPNDYVYVFALTPRHVEALCRAIDRPDLLAVMRPLGAPGDGGAASDVDPMEEISRWTRGRSKHEAMRILGEAGVPCSAVFDTVDLYEDPHLRARGFVETLEHEEQGPLRVPGSPVRLSASRVATRAAPLLGRHTAEVLRADLGLDDARLEELRTAGAIA